ncbi:hypothetical protein SUGI_0897900 [Cryptomeria japonica]|uniref:uncharacterized protein LOC131077928 n=1 Tax=Cryptomeria japonica TaxID=3369 RepID=UPI002414AF9C|nr:uncharacterized protein LOC131077928 [Cryptomeria japonica]GLJ43246.1 hypothetical protein SUGI_0897900 [Cryptomeria japonica]
MAANRDENPLIVGAPDAEDSPFVDRNPPTTLLCCCAEFPLWSDKLKGSLRRGKEWSVSIVCARKLINLFKKLKKSKSLAIYSSNQTKSGRFQYDAFSYALNFDDGSVDEDEYSLRAFSARFACPIAKPRDSNCPLHCPSL